MDLRGVNKVVISDKYSLSTVDELASQFHSSKVFSKLDLSQGYLQIPLTEKGRNIAAFISHDGIVWFKRMPFLDCPLLPSASHGVNVCWLQRCHCLYLLGWHRCSWSTQEEHDR